MLSKSLTVSDCAIDDVSRLLGLEDLSRYKLYAARYNQEDHPLDVFLEDRGRWADWSRYFNGRHDFNRPYVLAMMDFYPERDAWLFGCVYRIRKPPAETLSRIERYPCL